MPLKYNIVTDDGDPSSVTIFPSSGKPMIATREHPNFPNIMEGITLTGQTEDEIVGLFDVAVGLTVKFNKVSDRVSIRNGMVYFDNMPTESVLTDAIIQFHLAGHKDFMSLVNFMEKIETNPNPHSKEHLFRWLKSGKFSITPDGDIIAYKGVNRETGYGVVKAGDAPDAYVSTRSGPAIVDGEPVKGYVPNNPGVIVEMARNEVTFDPRVTCSQGLHVADWSYAKGMGNVVLLVLVNPRDVVSVPTDASDKKMRVCRYKVLQKVEAEETEMLHVNRELQTMTAHTITWTPPPKRVLERSTSPRKTVKKAAARVKKAVKKATTKAAPKVSTPAKKATTKPVGKPSLKGKVSTTVKTAPLPKYYEQFTLANFATLPYNKLVWLAGQWEVKPTGGRSSANFAKALADEAKKRLAKASKTKDQTKV